MNVISTYQTTTDWYAPSSIKTSSVKEQHHKKQTQAATSAAELLSSSTQTNATNPLDSLVSAGTITSEQVKAIQSAFESSKMAYKTQAGATSASKNH